MKNRILSLFALTLPLSALGSILGISWFGFETETRALACDWTNSVPWHVKNIKNLGFNTIRLPFSWQFVTEGHWGEMDTFFEATKAENISVVLDFHRLHATHQSAKPYDSEITFDQFLEAWHTILTRYSSKYPQLTTVDIFNEYQGDSFSEWNNLSRQIVSYIETSFPGRFAFFVGGVQWGGNVHFSDLSDMSCADRITYSIHKYSFSDKEPLEDAWLYSFGQNHLFPNKVTVNVGEYGFLSSNPEQVAWFRRFATFLKKSGVRDTFLWTYSWNSGDTEGIVLHDCVTVDEVKMELIREFWKGSSKTFLRRG